MRRRGLSLRLKLTLSYAGFLMVAGSLFLAVVWVYLLRYVPVQLTATDAFRSRAAPNRQDLLSAFVPKASIVMAALLVIGLVGGWVVAGRMLAPLGRITSVTRQAGRGRYGSRVRLEGRSDEVRELADAFDTMLDRVESHVQEQQRFAANASHELRTPLAITQTMLEAAAHDPERDVDVLVGRLHVINRRAIDLTEALLMLSRAGRGAFHPEPVDLSLTAEEACETLLPMASRHGVAMDVSCDRAVVMGSPALVGQLVVNLVHNAIVHNVLAGGRVWIATTSTSAGIELVVENTGAVLPADLLPTLTEPFQRGVARARTRDDGVGLGLAIVERIVDVHGANLELRGRPGGGLVATVRWPDPAARVRGHLTLDADGDRTASQVVRR